MGITAVFNVSGVDKDKFQKHIKGNSATYLDWSRTWNQGELRRTHTQKKKREGENVCEVIGHEVGYLQSTHPHRSCIALSLSLLLLLLLLL